MVLKIKKLHPDAKLPCYANSGDAGLDIYSVEDVEINPGERKMISTGISLAIPKGCVGLIWDKSGMAAKHGLKSMAGVIDTGFRGELKVVLHNLSEEKFSVEKGKKVAQMLIQPIHQKEVVEVSELDETQRGIGAWGSTGLN